MSSLPLTLEFAFDAGHCATARRPISVFTTFTINNVVMGHYIFALWFLLLSSFSSSNLSRCRLDVYHTSTHGVVLVRIWDADLKRATRGSVIIQDAKNRHLGTIAQLYWAMSSQLSYILTIGKNVLNSDTSSSCPHNMVNFGPLTAEICWRV